MLKTDHQLYRYYEDHNLDSLMEIVEELRKMIEGKRVLKAWCSGSIRAYLANLSHRTRPF